MTGALGRSFSGRDGLGCPEWSHEANAGKQCLGLVDLTVRLDQRGGGRKYRRDRGKCPIRANRAARRHRPDLANDMSRPARWPQRGMASGCSSLARPPTRWRLLTPLWPRSFNASRWTHARWDWPCRRMGQGFMSPAPDRPARFACIDVARASQRIVKRIPAGHTAMAPVLSPDDRRLYVCNRFDNDVSIIELSSGRELRRVRVEREPVAAALTPRREPAVGGQSSAS